jgi:hypothetical protein
MWQISVNIRNNTAILESCKQRIDKGKQEVVEEEEEEE